MNDSNQTFSNIPRDVKSLQAVLIYKEKLLNITNRINAASDINEILVNLQQEILNLFDADRITIYVVDKIKSEIYSKLVSGGEINEIRLKINKLSIAGYTASTRQLLSIINVYDDAEVKRICPDIEFNKSYDIKTGYTTKQVLTCPIIFQDELAGVLQLINKKGANQFNLFDVNCAREISKILGIAFFNQQQKNKKFTSRYHPLLHKNLVTEEELNQATINARQQKKSIEEILLKDYKLNKNDLLESLSLFYNCKFIDFNPNLIIPQDLLAGLNINYLKKNIWLPIKKEDEIISVLIDDPLNINKIDEIQMYLKTQKITFIGSLREDILKLIDVLIAPDINDQGGKVNDLLTELKEEEGEQPEEEDSVKESDNTIIKLANQIIRDAYNKGASDIHIEPYLEKQPTLVRLRIDGECIKYLEVPATYKKALISRLKIMARLNIAERRLPQSGKIKFLYNKKKVELRVEVTPTVGGNEDIVMRILAASEPIPLDKMNLGEYNLKYFKEIITKPYGLVLVVGPTGSGKTTTLHSAVGYINKPETKIWTAEDPVEITQHGLRQVQVHKDIGYTFANAMRSFLRADPDVVMIGEMRDTETAAIGIEASLTGHLVFSTLHTNSAPETVIRLLDMEMDAYNFANALLGILAQRLVRTLCKECKQPYIPNKEEFEELRHEYGEKEFDKTGINYSNKIILYKPIGCDICAKSGYKGRTGIHEFLFGTDEVKRLIISETTMEKLREAATTHGMTTLKQDGIMKVFKGYTDLKQVRKVCIR
ncbi:MAG: GspE/PulE family protein [bacterium]